MELGQVGAENLVFECGEDAVARVLVQRHAALASVAGNHHPRAHDAVRAAVHEWCDDVGQALGRVLPVAMKHHDDVQA